MRILRSIQPRSCVASIPRCSKINGVVESVVNIMEHMKVFMSFISQSCKDRSKDPSKAVFHDDEADRFLTKAVAKGSKIIMITPKWIKYLCSSLKGSVEKNGFICNFRPMGLFVIF